MNPGTHPLPFLSLPPPTYQYFTAQTPSIIPLACSKETEKASPSNHLKYPYSHREREPRGISLPPPPPPPQPTLPYLDFLHHLLFPFFPPPALPSLSLSNPFHYPPPPISHPLFSIVGRCSSSSLSRTPFDNCAPLVPRTFFVRSRLRIDYYYCHCHYYLLFFAPKAEPYLPTYRTTSSRLTIGCRSLLCVLQVPPRANPLCTTFSFPFFFYSFQNIRST